MDELTQLAIKYGTDKWGKHHYTPVYYDLFKNRRNEVKKFLEIGPAEGAGLFMFRDFFPNATIYGAEVEDDRVSKLSNLERIQVYKCDQSSGNSLRSTIGRIGFDTDIIIDDGSHKASDQVFSALEILDWMVNPKFIYIIEDVAEPDVATTLRNYLPKFFQVKTLTVSHRYDDRLIIIRRI